MKKFKKILFILLSLLLFFLYYSCLSDKIALEEIKPPIIEKPKEEKPKEEEVKKIPAVSGPILEIEEVGGEQRFIYLKLGTNNRIYRGLKGYIYNDPTMSGKIGKFLLVEVYKDYAKGRIMELNFKIQPNAVVQIEIDPKNLIE